MNVKSAVVASYDYQKQTLSGDCALTLSPYLKAFGGAGIGSVVGVGAYGTATVDVEIQIIGTTAPTGLNKIDLTGELGIKAYLATFVYENHLHIRHIIFIQERRSLPRAHLRLQIRIFTMQEAILFRMFPISAANPNGCPEEVPAGARPPQRMPR